MKEKATLILGDCAEKLKEIPDESVDLVVTSPPYDNLRTYKGYTFEFETVAGELARVIKTGGVIVWVVGDATINGSKTGTSFIQAIYFKNLGLNLHDVMIWNKKTFSAVGALQTKYAPIFEYMLILSKSKIKTFNPIKDRPNKYAGAIRKKILHRKPDGSQFRTPRTANNGITIYPEYGQRFNIWEIPADNKTTKLGHPAPFPLQLAKDHIISWSNEGDIILDPMMGSGTTGVAAIELNRKFIGIEIASEYFEMAKTRIENSNQKPPEIIEQNKIPQQIEYDNIFE
ncbi:MAG: site-specific DNA-methyltransferase [Oligoflexales bacterium]|nr:site-specific DNA-methyltransferase [Oligoflexales bacterium]